MAEKIILLTVAEIAKYGVSERALYRAKAEKRLVTKEKLIDGLKSLAKLKRNQIPGHPDNIIRALELAIADRGGAIPSEQPSPEPERDRQVVADGAGRRHRRSPTPA